MEEGDDPFSKAWEASPQSSTFPGTWSAAPQASGDPWGPKVKEEPWTSKNGPEHDHLDEQSKGTPQLNTVFQQCNINDAQSAIGNQKNNSHMHSNELNQSGFDDNFGEWSETDVLFKSGLLDQEFKTVSVTAEEDDLWSSADFSALNSLTTQDANQRSVERSKISSIQEEVDVSKVDGSTRGDESSPSSVNVSSTTSQSCQNKPSRSVVSQDQGSILSGQVQSGQVQLGEVGDIEGDSSGPSITSNPTSSVTHSMLNSTAGADGSSSVSEQPKVNCTPPSLLGTTVPSENTSIIPTQNIDASNSEASLSVNAGNRNLYSVGEVDKLSDSTLAHTDNKSISLHISDTALRTFEDSKEKRIMGNILDSDKEEKDNMEAVDVGTQDKGEQAMPSDPEDKSAAPTVDLKESVAVKENGTDAMVNGERGDNEIPFNDSLDTQTQTREDEFPPDDDYAEDTQPEAEPEKVVLAEENGVVESQGVIGTEDAAASDLPDVIEKEDSSEGYGSQDADKTLDSENGTETIVPVEIVPVEVVAVEKEEEKEVSQDEGLASPESEDSNAVSTLESVQTIKGEVVERGNVDKGVDLVIVDCSLEFDPNIVSNGDNPVPQGVPEVIEIGDNTGTEQTQGALELWAENKQMDRNEEGRNSETNISSNGYTDQTDIIHDAYTGTQNISDREEGQVTNDGMSGQGDVSESDIFLQSSQNNSVPSKEVDINTIDKGMNQYAETAVQQESFISDNSQTEPLVEFVQGSNNCVGGGPEMNSLSQKEEASDLSLRNLDSEKECSAGISEDVPADIVSGTLGVPQLTEQPLKESSDKEEGLKVVEGSRYPDNQEEIFQECNTNGEAYKSLDLDRELDINNSELGKESIENSELTETTEMVKPLEENVVEFVDEVLNKAMEQLSSEQTEASQEDFQENKEVGDAFSGGGAKEEGAVMDDKSSGLVGEVDNSLSDEKEFSKDIDMDTNGNVKLNLNLTSDTLTEEVRLEDTSSEVDKIEGGVVSAGDKTPEKNSASELIGSSGSATRSQRWSVPAGSFTNNQFSYADQTTESSTAYVKREPSPLEKRQFRPVRFRPASSSSEAKLRRTSLGVPRGWNAPPVDVLLPMTGREDTDTAGQIPLEAGPSSLTSDTSTSSGSSMSIHSSQSSEGLKPRKQDDIFRAEPIMVTADVVEAQDSAPVEAEPKSEIPEGGASHDSTLDDSTDKKSEHLLPSPVLHSTPSPSEKKPNVEEPPVPATVKRTPPLSQKVQVYEIKDAPITSPTSASMREAFSQNRSVTEGEGVNRKKISQAERERQELLASLRVRRPVKEKWQGQIEQEEKNKGKQVQLDETSIKSLKGYEERKKLKIKSKSLDLSVSGEISVAKPQETEAELNNTSSSQESSLKEEQLNRLRHHRPHSLNFDGESGDITQGELYISKEEVLSPNGDTCSSGYTSGRSTPAGEDASRLLSLPKHGGLGDSPLYKEYQKLLKETQDAEEADDQRLPSREEMGLRAVVPEEPETVVDQEEEPQSPQQKSFVQKEVKMREKKINSRVVKQHRISFVEQEVLRQKQQEEEFRREREMRDQERSQALSPSQPSPPSSTSGSNASSRLTSPTTPEPATKPAKAAVKQPPSKAKAVYQELQYNPKVGGGNRSSAMVKQWESKFKK